MFFGWGDHQGLTYASSILSMLEMVKNDKVETEVISNGHVPKEAETEENHYDNGPVISDEKRRSGISSEAPWLVHCRWVLCN